MLDTISNFKSAQLYIRSTCCCCDHLPRPRPTIRSRTFFRHFHFPPELPRGNIVPQTFAISKKLCPFLGQGQRLVLGLQRPPRPSKTSCLLWPKRRGSISPISPPQRAREDLQLVQRLGARVCDAVLTSFAYHSLSTRWNRTIIRREKLD